MRRVVVASANPGKQREFAALLAPFGIELLLQSTLGIASVEETGNTFTDNALLKAHHAARLANLPALADDSGLEVDALGGRPGVRSARYAGDSASDADNNALLLHELQGIEAVRRGARYRCVLALVWAGGDPTPLLAQGCWEGRIAAAPAGSGGFGYDPLFLPEGFDVTAAQLSAQQKNTVSHRAVALRALAAQIGRGGW